MNTTIGENMKRECKKCGSIDDVRIKHFQSGKTVASSNHQIINNQFLKTIQDGDYYKKQITIKECLSIDCGTCGYSWQEPPINND